MIKKTKEYFIKEASDIHNNSYDYSLVNYINNNTKVKILCSKHGEFEQKPIKHINAKQGCPKCGNINTSNKQRLNNIDFINQANIIHKNKYDYNKVNYKNNRNKVKIICSVHGEFEQIPSNHLKGKGCKYCGGTAKMDTNLFINKAKLIHGDKWDYSLVNYINSLTNIKIICPEHGIFEQTPNNHLSKEQGCYKCLDKIHDTDSFVKYCSCIHNNKYDYSLVKYILITNSIDIICPIHGKFEIRADSHRNGFGCKQCSNNGTSKEQKEISDFITSLGIEVDDKNTKILNGKEIDIYLPLNKIAIEYNGLYWHSELYKSDNYHINKTEECDKLGIRLIHIFEDEWLFKKDIVKSRIKNVLGLTEKKIYARKCEIKELNTKECSEFITNNHIQGNLGASIKIGLFYDKQLVSVMTFGKRPMINKSQYELLRFCNKINTSVVGGADKLLKYFIKKYSPNEITTYADRRWSQGNLYDKLGFKFSHNSKPNFYYFKGLKRYNRLVFQKHILIKQGFDKNKTAKQIMFENKIYRIFDSGNKCYKMTFI